MNTGKIKYFLPLLAALLLGSNACKKKNGPATLAGKLQGRWKMTQYAPDNGKNPLIYSPLPAVEDFEWTFNSGGTGYDIETWKNVEGLRETFSYKATGDSLWIGTSTHDTTTYYVSDINADIMILIHTHMLADSNTATEGFYFNRH